MKKVMMIAVMIIAFGFIKAQPPKAEGSKGDKIEALRIAFISERLNLTPVEAQNFSPVYNQYRSDLETVRKNFKQSPEVKLTAEQQLDMEQKKLDLKKKYKPQFEAALGKTKVDQLYNLENEFREKLKELHEQRQHEKGNGEKPGGRH